MKWIHHYIQTMPKKHPYIAFPLFASNYILLTRTMQGSFIFSMYLFYSLQNKTQQQALWRTLWASLSFILKVVKIVVKQFWNLTRAYLNIILFFVNSIDILSYKQYYSNICNIATINDSPQSTHVETADHADSQ